MDYVQLVANMAGSGAATTVIGWLFKRRFEQNLEVQKALLQRASKVHERQVTALTDLYRDLHRAQDYLQLMTKSFVLEGEDTQKYPSRFKCATARAYRRLEATRLLLPQELVQQCEEFFRSLWQGQVYFGFARDRRTPDGPERAALWKNAHEVARNTIPVLLRDIETAGRAVVDGRESLV